MFLLDSNSIAVDHTIPHSIAVAVAPPITNSIHPDNNIPNNQVHRKKYL